MNNDLLREKLNNLYEYKCLKIYLQAGHPSVYKIKIKKQEVGFDDLFTSKKSMKISRDLLVGIVDSRIGELKQEIEELKMEV